MKHILRSFLLSALLAFLLPPASFALRPMSLYHDLVAGQGEPGWQDGTFSEALFHDPTGLAFNTDGTCLFVADMANNRIRVVWMSENNRVETLAGTGAPGKNDGKFQTSSFNAPSGLVFIPGDRLIINDSTNHLLRSLDLRSGTVTTMAIKDATSGPAKTTEFVPGTITSMVYFAKENALYIAQDKNALIKLNLKTNQIIRLSTPDIQPFTLCVFHDKICVADQEKGVFQVDVDTTKPDLVTTTVTALGKTKGILAMAVSGENLYALRTGSNSLVKAVDGAPVSLMSASGYFFDDNPNTSPLFYLRADKPLGFISDPSEANKLYIASADQQSILMVKDYNFDWYKYSRDPNSQHLMDFEIPVPKPRHTFRILLLGDSHLITDLGIDPKQFPWGYNRMETISKRMELYLNALSALEDGPTDFQVLNKGYGSDGTYPYFWTYYEAPTLIDKYDADLVIILQTPLFNDCLDYFKHPITAEGIPSEFVDAEFLLKPYTEKIPPGVPQDFYERCKAAGWVKVSADKTHFEFAEPSVLRQDAEIEKDTEIMMGKPFDLLNHKILKMKTKSGNPVKFISCFSLNGESPIHGQVRNRWRNICKKTGIQEIDLTEPFLALKNSFDPVFENCCHAHYTTYGSDFMALLLAHELIHLNLVKVSAR